jgi:hypothetical protein
MIKFYRLKTVIILILFCFAVVFTVPVSAQRVPTAKQLIAMYEAHRKGDIFQVKQYANRLGYNMMDKVESDRVFIGRMKYSRAIWAMDNGDLTFKDKNHSEGLFKDYYNQLSNLTDKDYAVENTFFFEFDDKTIYLDSKNDDVFIAIRPKNKLKPYKSKSNTNTGKERYTPKSYNETISFVKEYTVIGKTSTRVYLNKGDKVKIKASGEVSYGLFAGSGGPRGIRGFEQYNIIRNLPHGCLIATIGEGGAWYYIGNEATIEADKDGFLKLYVNDTDPGNNTGKFIVMVEKI